MLDGAAEPDRVGRACPKGWCKLSIKHLHLFFFFRHEGGQALNLCNLHLVVFLRVQSIIVAPMPPFPSLNCLSLFLSLPYS